MLNLNFFLVNCPSIKYPAAIDVLGDFLLVDFNVSMNVFVADIWACIFECVLWLQKSKNNIMLSSWILQVRNTVLMGTVKQLVKLDGIFLVKINNMLALMLFLSCVVSVVFVV